MSKYFVVSNEIKGLSREDIAAAHELQTKTLLKNWQNNLGDFEKGLLKEKQNISPVDGRVLVIANLHSKSTHKFENGTEISIARGFDNFNRRETQPVNGVVLAHDKIPVGSEIVMHHNAVDPNNEVFNYSKLGEESANVKYLSVPIHDCYLYREPNTETWKPCEGFATALRCYTPYKGPLKGIKPTLLKNRLLITSGKYEGLICVVANGAAYEMVYQGIDGRENRTIRLRTFDYDNFEREEIFAVDNLYSQLYDEGTILVGLDAEHAKPKD